MANSADRQFWGQNGPILDKKVVVDLIQLLATDGWVAGCGEGLTWENFRGDLRAEVLT